MAERAVLESESKKRSAQKNAQLEENENVVEQQAGSLKKLRTELSEKESKLEKLVNVTKEQKKELEEKEHVVKQRQLH